MTERRIRLKYTQPQLDIFFPSQPERHTIIPKGRRFGATHGAAHACIEWMLEGMPILWGDTVHGNIMRYVDRCFIPALTNNGVDYDWNRQDKVLKVGTGFTDFRSADRPENWEGFGYRKIVLNEAGIILLDPYLYTNAVRPMMLDFPDAELYALGVPKGMKLRNGKEHPFYTLWSRVGMPGYRGQAYSSYDNPILRTEDIDALKVDMSAMDPEQIDQEIYGRFIDRVSGNPFAFAFDESRHVKACAFRPGEPVRIVMDFNVEPLCASLWHVGQNYAHCFAEIAIKTGTLEAMQRRIREIIGNTALIELTGDHNGNNRGVGINSTTSLFDGMRSLLRLSPRQLILKPNPSHLKSREDYNFILANFPDYRIDPSCTRMIADHRSVEVDDTGKIIKSDRSQAAQQADMLDTARYLVNTYLCDWITKHRNELSRHGALRERQRLPSDHRDLIRRVAGEWV